MWNEIPRFFFLPSPTYMPSIAAAVCSAARRRGEKSYLIVNSFWAPMHNVVKCMKKSHLYACTLWFDMAVAFPMLFVRFCPPAPKATACCLPAYMPVCLQTVHHILVCPVGESQQKTDPLEKAFAATGKYVYYFQTYSVPCLYCTTI